MKKQSKSLSILQIIATLCISYLCVSYFNADWNPFNWASHVRFFQGVATGISLLIQYGIKNDSI